MPCWHGSAASLSPSTTLTNYSNDLPSICPQRRNFVRHLCVPAAHKPTAILRTNSKLKSRRRLTDPGRASVTHLPSGISNHTHFLSSTCNWGMHEGMENTTHRLIFNLKTADLSKVDTKKGLRINYSAQKSEQQQQLWQQYAK